MRRSNIATFFCLTLQFALLPASDNHAQDTSVAAGIRAYQDGHYQSAAASFRNALEIAPQDSSLHHWLGRCYGRIAEHGNWFAAISYAKKTLKQFRKAVELDSNNYEALRDLINYLETAPRMLGGNGQEAKHLRQRLEALRAAREEQ